MQMPRECQVKVGMLVFLLNAFFESCHACHRACHRSKPCGNQVLIMDLAEEGAAQQKSKTWSFLCLVIPTGRGSQNQELSVRAYLKLTCLVHFGTCTRKFPLLSLHVVMTMIVASAADGRHPRISPSGCSAEWTPQGRRPQGV